MEGKKKVNTFYVKIYSSKLKILDDFLLTVNNIIYFIRNLFPPPLEKGPWIFLLTSLQE